MEQIILTQAQYLRESKRHRKETGRSFLDDYRVTCYVWPLLDPRFGQLVCTHKDFYRGVLDVPTDRV